LTIRATSTADTGKYGEVTVTVTEPTGGTTISLNIVDEGASFTVTGWPVTPTIYKTGGVDKIELEIADADYTYTWYVDGVQKAIIGTVAISAGDYPLGGHSLLLIGVKSGVYWSKVIGSFRVAAHP
jgi:hypothetical protein